jgi:S1-C subfamily serine protease
VWLSAAQYTGLIVGVILGAALAPAASDALGIADPGLRRLAAVMVLIVGGSIGSSVGYAAAAAARGRVAAPPNEAEHITGAIFSGLAVLGVAWFLGLTFDRGPVPQVAQLVQQSLILKRLDAAAPRPPGFLARVEAVLADAPFPQAFAVLNPTLPGPLPLPTQIDTVGVRAAESVTFRVSGRGCSGIVTGSAFPISPDHLVTNAHVVSGTTGTSLSQDNPRFGTPASVVLFDPQRDVAVLYVPGAHYRVPSMGTAQRGTEGAVIGYPEGGPEDASPAVVDGSLQARGRDIYNQNVVDRQIYVLGATVHPGNSGGPLVDLEGRVLGLVFAASSTNPDQAYALTNDEIAADLQAGSGRTARIDTSQYQCAV